MTDAEKIAALEATVKAQGASIARLEAFAMAIQQAVGGGKPSGSDVASDRELDGEKGDPKLRFSPRDWHGKPVKGLPMSQCPPDALDLFAEAMDYFARKNEDSGKPDKAKWDRVDARRARGWAKRLRDGWRPPERAPEPEGFEDQGPDPFDSQEPAFGGFPSDEEIPF